MLLLVLKQALREANCSLHPIESSLLSHSLAIRQSLVGDCGTIFAQKISSLAFVLYSRRNEGIFAKNGKKKHLLGVTLSLSLCRMLGSISSAVRASCPSRLVNAWNVVLGGRAFTITPAHVALYANNGVWCKSEFLKQLPGRWQIPRMFVDSEDALSDFAWKEIENNNSSGCLKTSVIENDDPVDVTGYFRQPYDRHGNWAASESAFGAMSTVLYRSPQCNLLEAIDVGFRGFSGALFLREDAVVGLFLRRGTNITRNVQPKKSLHHHQSKALLSTRSHEAIFPPSSPPSDTTEQSALLEAFRQFEIRAESRMLHLEKTVSEMMSSLRSELMNKNDFEVLLNVMAMRRGLAMPCSMMLELLNGDSVLLDDLVGKPAAGLNRN